MELPYTFLEDPYTSIEKDMLDAQMAAEDARTIAEAPYETLAADLRDMGYPVPADHEGAARLTQAIASWRLPLEYDGRAMSEFGI